MLQLGKLSFINDIREVWPNEAKDFTPWLAQNLDSLGEELGFDFDVKDDESMIQWGVETLAAFKELFKKYF